jgi:radical SAM/Cys-rich protein
LYHLTIIMHKIYPLIKDTDFPRIRRSSLKTIQVNLGYKCNQSCIHCHVNAGPKRKEMMEKKTIDNVVDFAINNNIQTVDLTGGAPEINKHFRYMVEKLKQHDIHIIDRCNLTILNKNSMKTLPDFFVKHKIEIIASLPCYIKKNVDSQRGKGVFEESISILRQLNNLGYGTNKDLILNLVYNPQGPVLPPSQDKLENDYKSYLRNSFDIEFNNLFTITNMPINRFGSVLVSQNKFNSYMKLLKSSFSEKAKENVMCKQLISIDYNGNVFDCDFNQMLKMNLSYKKTHITEISRKFLKNKIISTADHCYGCTAGSGSSCGGATI